jgi:hypothetical protein
MLSVRSRARDAGSFAPAALALLIALSARRDLRADSIVNFWLSNADAGPAVPVIYALPGSVGEIEVWARPAVSYRLSAFSLDLVAEQPGVLSFDSVDVLNPLLQVMPALYRHQLVFDSATGLDVAPDLIDSFLGFSFFGDAMGLPNGAGMGPLCGIDPDCSMASGAPSWHIATVTYEASMSFGAAELYLQIGEQGVWQSPAGAMEPDPPTETSAVFGLPDDVVNYWSNAGGIDHRHNHQGAADAVIQVAIADFDQDGDVDGADVLIWQRGVGVGMTLAEGDADGNADVDGVDLGVWRHQFGATATVLPAGSAVPEPTGLAAVAALGISSISGPWRRRGRR